MKDFMLIFVGTSYEAMDLSPEEMQARFGNWFQWQQKMEADGVVLKGGHALHSGKRHVSGPDRKITDRTLSDSTSAELKELVGGYYIVSAKDIEEATEIAQGYPDYDIGGTVEIREVMVFNR